MIVEMIVGRAFERQAGDVHDLLQRRDQLDQWAGIDRAASLAVTGGVPADGPQRLLIVGEAQAAGEVQLVGDVIGLVGEQRVGIVLLIIAIDRAVAFIEGRVRPEEGAQEVGVGAGAEQQVQIGIELAAIEQAVVRMQVLVRIEAAHEVIELFPGPRKT